MKQISLDNNTTSLLHELEFCKKMKNNHHPNVVSLYRHRIDEVKDIFDKNHTSLIVLIDMEYCNAGTLHDELADETNDLEPEQLKGCFLQLLHGIKFLHSYKITHYDIKPENIMRNKDSEDNITYKITDFGISGFVKSSHKTYQTRGTLLYNAVEMREKQELTPAVDIWALGLVFFHMITR